MQGGSNEDIENEIRDLYSSLRDSVPTQSGGSDDELRQLFKEIGVPHTDNLRDDMDNLVNGGYELNGGLNFAELKRRLSDNEISRIFYQDGSPKPYGIILGILFLISTLYGFRKSRQLAQKTGELKGKTSSFEFARTELANIKKELGEMFNKVEGEATDLYERVKLFANRAIGKSDIVIDNVRYNGDVLELMSEKLKLESELKIANLTKEARIQEYKKMKTDEIEKLKNELKGLSGEKLEKYDVLLKFINDNNNLFDEYGELKAEADEGKKKEFNNAVRDIKNLHYKYRTIKKLGKEIESNKFIGDDFKKLSDEINEKITKIDDAIQKLRVPQLAGGHYLDLNFCISCLLYLIIFLLLFIVVASLTGNEKMSDYIQAGFG